jgi:hypothetical protein
MIIKGFVKTENEIVSNSELLPSMEDLVRGPTDKALQKIIDKNTDYTNFIKAIKGACNQLFRIVSFLKENLISAGKFILPVNTKNCIPGREGPDLIRELRNREKDKSEKRKKELLRK